MSGNGYAQFTPFFLDGVDGRILSVFFEPRSPLPGGPCVLYIPPFAEEMNKARRQVALQAREFAKCGFATLILDLYGTGDSAGDFGDARWETWLADLTAGIAWIEGRGSTLFACLALRLGALLVQDLTKQFGSRPHRILLWQPVINGKSFVTQFLRTKTAAQAISGTGSLQTTDDLREQLYAGTPVEVAGYSLHPDLVRRIEQQSLQAEAFSVIPGVDWLEVSPQPARGMSPASRKVVQSWAESGVNLNEHVVAGDPFWTTAEIATAPLLTRLTTSLLADSSR